MSAKRTGSDRRDGDRAERAKRPQSGPAPPSKRPTSRGAIKEEVSRPGTKLQGKADESPAPGALRPLARALIELAVALRREDEDEKGAPR